MVNEVMVGGFAINATSRSMIIAEAGVNYYDIASKLKIEPMEAARMMVKEAAEAGADAIKFQTYKAEKISIKNSPAYWDTSKESTKTQYELFKKFDGFGEAEYRELSIEAKRCGTIFLSTPFDFESADFLSDMMPAFKISSSDLNNTPFLQHIATKGKPILLSTGASTEEEVRTAVSAIAQTNPVELILLHCVLNYPTAIENSNLLMMNGLKRLFPNHWIGVSDHTVPDAHMALLTAAAGMGAKVIEKHFTLDKGLNGNDHYHSMDTKDLMVLRSNIEVVSKALGTEIKAPLASEDSARMYARRSIVTTKLILKGTIISRDMVDFKRPGTGLSPNDIAQIIGRKARKDIENDAQISLDEIE